MIEKIKKAIRISNASINDEVEDTIRQCYADMHRKGIKIYDDDGEIRDCIKDDPLVLACQKNYARWQFNFENQAERYEKAYQSMSDGLSLSGDYNDVQ